MEGWEIPYRHSVQIALDLLRGRWTVAVMAALARGRTPFKELLAAINDVEKRTDRDRMISNRVLSDTLQRAREDGLVERYAESGNFATVSYALTPTGRSLLRAVRPLAEWAQVYQADEGDRQGP
ncbi:transcriptional regulator [Amycolatopsis sp. WAC 04197]|uniref:winged helix-turn-helix transcriptional regulator n=1 Tax=Amycolatopsis sp. WAC 04197 TaxID=2203199 RepID=UPI000F780FEE|nr:helix-turn-helix domain-containing protein [Amycolatopsis sp. WAC 04197]RSN45124.1 transcriptional regulator [Amycolatopsis sp. WAC 04197]